MEKNDLGTAEFVKNKLRLLEPSGIVSRERIVEVLQAVGVQPSDIGCVLSFFGAAKTIEIDAFVNFLWGAPAPASWKTSTEENCHLLSWNIRSPELAWNIFEMYPGEGIVQDREQNQLFMDLIAMADQMCLNQDTSESLDSILPNDEPLQVLNDSSRADELENQVLSDKHKESMKKFFAPRIPAADLDAFVTEWLAKPQSRWNYWKNQKAHEFIADDGSGGKSEINKTLAKVPQPVLDAVAWDLALGVCDMKCRFRPTRLTRTKRLHPPGNTVLGTDKKVPEPGQNDFFKLLVWDLIVNAVIERARTSWKGGLEQWDSTFDGLKRALSSAPTFEEYVRQTCSVIVKQGLIDILVLVECNQELITGDDPILVRFLREADPNFKYVLLRNEVAMEAVSNVVVLLREGAFLTDDIKVEPFVDDKGQALGRGLGVLCTSARDYQRVQILGLHLPSNGYNIPEMSAEVERRLARNLPTIVCGDLNLDLRDAKKMKKLCGDRPLLARLIEGSRPGWDQPPTVGTVNKRRTPFQAQASKINLEDFTIKDAICTSVPGLGRVDGYIGLKSCLPSRDNPSDHAPLRWHSATWPATAVSSR